MEMLLDPTILFFCLGVIAVWVKSNIEIPPQITKFLSYYLLMSIGFKGGVELSKSHFNMDILWTIVAGVTLAVLVPIWMFYILKKKLEVENAAAAAACYGSVSAVTFLTGISWLENRGLTFSGHMVALMALMESPAIIVGLMLAKTRGGASLDLTKNKFSLKEVLHDAFFNGSVFILMGSMFIGYVIDNNKAHDYQTFVYDIFKGFLCFFLLDLGMSAARQVKELKSYALFLSALAMVAPLVNATIALLIAKLIGLSPQDGFLFMILVGSSSYIAVPAALKSNLPSANPSIYLSMSLGLTFPMNLLFGLPLYWRMAEYLLQ